MTRENGKITNKENIANYKTASRDALMSLVDECNNAIKDKRDINIPSSKTAIIFDYYFYFFREVMNVKKWAVIIFFGIAFMFVLMGEKNFVISADKNINEIILGLVLFVIVTAVTLTFFKEHNIESFFLRLYPNFKKEKHYEKIITTIGKETFKRYKLKESGYRLAVCFFIALCIFHALNYFVFNFGASIFISWAFFVVYIIIQNTNNFVFENKF